MQLPFVGLLYAEWNTSDRRDTEEIKEKKEEKNILPKQFCIYFRITCGYLIQQSPRPYQSDFFPPKFRFFLFVSYDQRKKKKWPLPGLIDGKSIKTNFIDVVTVGRTCMFYWKTMCGGGCMFVGF